MSLHDGWHRVNQKPLLPRGWLKTQGSIFCSCFCIWALSSMRRILCHLCHRASQKRYRPYTKADTLMWPLWGHARESGYLPETSLESAICPVAGSNKGWTFQRWTDSSGMWSAIVDNIANTRQIIVGKFKVAVLGNNVQNVIIEAFSLQSGSNAFYLFQIFGLQFRQEDRLDRLAEKVPVFFRIVL